MDKVIITGSTSMIGLALTATCLAHGTRVIATVREDSPHLCRLPQHPLLTVIPCSLNEMATATLPYEAHNCDVFYHLAWAHTGKQGRVNPCLQNVNISATLDAVNFAARLGCKRFVGAGSQAEYGFCDGPMGEDHPVAPSFAYGVAKYAAGRLAALQCEQKGLVYIWGRIFSVYGPYDMETTLAMSCIGELLRNRRPVLSACTQLWDYLYSADAGEALYLLGEKGKPGAIYNVGSGEARPLREYVNILRDAIDPALPLGIGEKQATGNLQNLCVDITRLRADTGFVPTTSFENGIRKTINWYRKDFL